MPKEEYLKYLEELRKSGATNMFGAAPYLEAKFGLTRTEARDVLRYWMDHYGELAEKFGW